MSRGTTAFPRRIIKSKKNKISQQFNDLKWWRNTTLCQKTSDTRTNPLSKQTWFCFFKNSHNSKQLVSLYIACIHSLKWFGLIPAFTWSGLLSVTAAKSSLNRPEQAIYKGSFPQNFHFSAQVAAIPGIDHLSKNILRVTGFAEHFQRHEND